MPAVKRLTREEIGVMTGEEFDAELDNVIKGIMQTDDPEPLNPGATLSDDLELDSLDLNELLMATEERFDLKPGISTEEGEVIVTVGDARDYLRQRYGRPMVWTVAA